MSLLASFMSAITILGTPAEIYVYGTQYWIIGLSKLIGFVGIEEKELSIYSSNQLHLYDLSNSNSVHADVREIGSDERLRSMFLAETKDRVIVDVSPSISVFREAFRSKGSFSCFTDLFDTDGRTELPLVHVRTLVSTAAKVIYMALVLYAPALALSQVTGLNVWISVISIGVICTLYTTVVPIVQVFFESMVS